MSTSPVTDAMVEELSAEWRAKELSEVAEAVRDVPPQKPRSRHGIGMIMKTDREEDFDREFAIVMLNIRRMPPRIDKKGK